MPAPLMFLASLFPIARTWKQPKCPSIDEWIKKLWYTYTMEYYTAVKGMNKAIFSNMDGPEIIILSELSQKEKDKYHMISLPCRM